jgi:hypothetical protein
MIDPYKAKVGFHVFYQQPHMRHPEYGLITSTDQMPHYVHVRFNGDAHSKACRPTDLHWPPDFCAADRVNPEGQPFATDWP